MEFIAGAFDGLDRDCHIDRVFHMTVYTAVLIVCEGNNAKNM